MTNFQYVALSILGLAFLREGLRWRGSTSSVGVRVARILLFGAATITIAYPGITQRLGALLGIGRGADFVFYVFILVSMGVAFYFYSEQVRLQRQITQVVRELALLEAERRLEVENLSSDSDRASPAAASKSSC